jgi:outer membrane protein W
MLAGAETDEVDSDTLDFDPLVILFGVGYRF